MNTENMKILLIDDDDVLLRALSRQLKDHGFSVETSICAAEARVMLTREMFHAIVCDHNMPGQTGLEFLEEIRKSHPELATFLLSGQVAGVSIAQGWARDIGVTEVFSKPCHSSWIASAIEQALSGQHAATGGSDQ